MATIKRRDVGDTIWTVTISCNEWLVIAADPTRALYRVCEKIGGPFCVTARPDEYLDESGNPEYRYSVCFGKGSFRKYSAVHVNQAQVISV